MSNIDREDIYELNELEKVIDIENIPYEKLMGIFIGFIIDELITKYNLEKLNIDNETETMIMHYAYQGKAFLDKRITTEELFKERISAWRKYKGLKDNSASNKLLRIVVCCLYDKEAAEFDRYGSEMDLELYFSLLMDLGKGFCNQFRYYLQKNWSEYK